MAKSQQKSQQQQNQSSTKGSDKILVVIENEEVTGQSGHVRKCLNQVKIS